MKYDNRMKYDEWMRYAKWMNKMWCETRQSDITHKCEEEITTRKVIWYTMLHFLFNSDV